jgi:hypothetical protein
MLGSKEPLWLFSGLQKSHSFNVGKNILKFEKYFQPEGCLSIYLIMLIVLEDNPSCLIPNNCITKEIDATLVNRPQILKREFLQ